MPATGAILLGTVGTTLADGITLLAKKLAPVEKPLRQIATDLPGAEGAASTALPRFFMLRVRYVSQADCAFFLRKIGGWLIILWAGDIIPGIVHHSVLN